jgi:hypothetical protein
MSIFPVPLVSLLDPILVLLERVLRPRLLQKHKLNVVRRLRLTPNNSKTRITSTVSLLVRHMSKMTRKRIISTQRLMRTWMHDGEHEGVWFLVSFLPITGIQPFFIIYSERRGRALKWPNIELNDQKSNNNSLI